MDCKACQLAGLCHGWRETSQTLTPRDERPAMMKLYLQIEKLAMSPRTEGPACEAEHSTALEDISMLLNYSEPRIRTKTGDLLAQLVPVLSQSALQGVGQLLLTSIALHLVRREETRPTTLGSCSEIGLDDTTGWSMLESAINAFHALLQGCLTTGNVLAVQLLAAQMPCDEDGHAGVRVVEMVFGRFAAHQSRYIREMTLTHTIALLAIPLAALDGLNTLCMQQLAGHVCCGLVRGLHDAFPQVRLAASKLTAQLLTVISQRELMEQMDSYLQHDASVSAVPERWVLMDTPEHLDDLLPTPCAFTASSSMQSTLVSALATYWRYLFPRLSLNRFYPADSIQTLSRQLYATLLTPQGVLGDIYQRYLLHTVEDALACYVVSSRQGNHSIVEAACCALADLPVRMITCSTAPPHPVVLPYLPLICEALYLAVVDERWPVADMAVQASAQLLHRLPCALQVQLLHPSDAHATYGDRFLSAYLTCLQHHVLTVRQHACMALLLQLTNDNRVLGMLGDFLTSSLLAALADDTKNKSFLPPAMLAPYALPPAAAAAGPLPLPGQAQKLPARSKGWDCCIDCVDSNRSIFGHELTASALHVLRELSLLPEPHTEQLTALLLGSKTMQTSSAAVYLKLTSQQQIAGQKLPGGRYGLQMHLADVLITLLREEVYPEHGKVADALYRMMPDILPHLQCTEPQLRCLLELLQRDLDKLTKDVEATSVPVVVPASAARASGSKVGRMNATSSTVRRASSDLHAKRELVQLCAAKVTEMMHSSGWLDDAAVSLGAVTLAI